MKSKDDYIVPPRRWAEIEKEADIFRDRLNLTNAPYIPVVDVIERVLDQKLGMIEFAVGTREEMNNAEGLTCPTGKFIMLREDVYKKACAGEGRARFTAAHELGHWLMHTNIPLARANRGDGTESYRLAEPQANQFAASLLMPENFINDAFDDEMELTIRFGVSFHAARVRLEWIRKNRRPYRMKAQVAARASK